MKARTTTTERDVEAAYEDAHLEAQAHLEAIRELLFELPAPCYDNDGMINWGHVGDLNAINVNLRNVVRFLKGD